MSEIKAPAYPCRLCGADALKGIPRDENGHIQPILFPDEVLRPAVYPSAHMHGVEAQLNCVSDSLFACKTCHLSRLTPQALAPFRGRSFDFVPSKNLRKYPPPSGGDGYYAQYCTMM